MGRLSSFVVLAFLAFFAFLLREDEQVVALVEELVSWRRFRLSVFFLSLLTLFFDFFGDLLRSFFFLSFCFLSRLRPRSCRSNGVSGRASSTS